MRDNIIFSPVSIIMARGMVRFPHFDSRRYTSLHVQQAQAYIKQDLPKILEIEVLK